MKKTIIIIGAIVGALIIGFITLNIINRFVNPSTEELTQVRKDIKTLYWHVNKAVGERGKNFSDGKGTGVRYGIGAQLIKASDFKPYDRKRDHIKLLKEKISKGKNSKHELRNTYNEALRTAQLLLKSFERYPHQSPQYRSGKGHLQQIQKIIDKGGFTLWQSNIW